MGPFITALSLAMYIVPVTSQPVSTTQPWQPPSEWDPALDIDKYPNPQNEPTKCKQKSSEFWLCDPNYVLTSTQSQIIVDQIRSIQEGTKHRLLVGVALVNELTSINQEEVGQKTDYFGASILNTTWSEFKSSCGDDCEGHAYVFLSWNDYQDFISTNIQDALPKGCQEEFIDLPKLLNASDVNSNFEYINATLNILGKYAGGQCEPEHYIPTALIVILIIVLVAAIVAVIVVMFIMTKRRSAKANVSKHEEKGLNQPNKSQDV